MQAVGGGHKTGLGTLIPTAARVLHPQAEPSMPLAMLGSSGPYPNAWSAIRAERGRRRVPLAIGLPALAIVSTLSRIKTPGSIGILDLRAAEVRLWRSCSSILDKSFLALPSLLSSIGREVRRRWFFSLISIDLRLATGDAGGSGGSGRQRLLRGTSFLVFSRIVLGKESLEEFNAMG